MKKFAILILLIPFISFLAVAQESAADEKLQWWGDIDGFYNQQHKVTLQIVDEALGKYPPTLEEPLERRMTMLMLDGVLHEENATKRTAVKEFLNRRIGNSIEQISQTEVKEGAIIWKLYNHGFIVRTPSVTIGFDLVRGNSWVEGGFLVDRQIYKQLVDECDVLFISHRHRDHADQWVAQSFIEQGKPVLAPPEVWKDEAIHSKLMHLKREANLIQMIDLPMCNEKLSLVNFPGHQGGDIENNVIVVKTHEGLSFAHTGDQSGPADEWEWIDRLGDKFPIDVLFPNCWTPDLPRMVKGMNPNLVITGHENEMGHTVDHRESNWLTYTRLKGTSKPSILMTWGEKFHYLPKDSN